MPASSKGGNSESLAQLLARFSLEHRLFSPIVMNSTKALLSGHLPQVTGAASSVQFTRLNAIYRERKKQLAQGVDVLQDRVGQDRGD